jgi:hypothetical protein
MAVPYSAGTARISCAISLRSVSAISTDSLSFFYGWKNWMQMTNDATPKRDPRKEPKAGDVLIEGRNRIEVTSRKGARVLYSLTSLPATSSTDRIPMECGLYLNRWREVLKNAEVIHHAD